MLLRNLTNDELVARLAERVDDELLLETRRRLGCEEPPAAPPWHASNGGC